MSDPRLKIISEVDAGENVLAVKKPFKLSLEQKRRFIRLEISEPVQMSILKDENDGFWPEGNGPDYTGSILNLSAGGVLIMTEAPLREGMIILMTMSLQDVEVIDNVIGLIKRVDDDSDERLVGVEFISRERLTDLLSHSEIELLHDDILSFDDQLKKTLNKYVYYNRVSKGNELHEVN